MHSIVTVSNECGNVDRAKVGERDLVQVSGTSEISVPLVSRRPGLKELLYADLVRQYEIEGKFGVEPNFLRFLGRLLHFRFLPRVFCRTSRAAMLAGIPIVPKLLTYLNLVLFGLEVTPKCEIGPGIFFAHPVGCVIGAWRIGSNVTSFKVSAWEPCMPIWDFIGSCAAKLAIMSCWGRAARFWGHAISVIMSPSVPIRL